MRRFPVQPRSSMARILLIDDDDSVRTMLRLTLAKFGHPVVEARNGKEGLKLFAAVDFDLVITDLVMPETEGFEVLGALRKQIPRVKVLVITGGLRGSVVNFREMALHLGADRVLAKPFSNDEFIATVNELLAGASLSAPKV